MNNSATTIDTYGIKEIRADAGEELQTNEFIIYNNREIRLQAKMFHPVRSMHLAVHLNLGQALAIKYNLIDYTIPKNSLFIVHPGIIHMLKQAENLPTISIGFTHDFLATSMMHKKHADVLGILSLQNDPLFLLTDEESQTLYSSILYLKEMLNKDGHPFKEEMIYHGFNLFMLEMGAISRKYRTNERQGMTRKQDILLGFLKLLADHFKEERSVQFYANALFMTPKHLTKTVKEITTKTCGEFIDEMVIAEAKISLNDRYYSVGQVADYLHFSDQFFFSKFFKRRTGLSPKEYKNSI